jgi:hypothetical protein
LAPLSVAEATILGVWISVKPRLFRWLRKPAITPRPTDRQPAAPGGGWHKDGMIELRLLCFSESDTL